MPRNINLGDNLKLSSIHIPYSSFNCSTWNPSLKHNLNVFKGIDFGEFSGAFSESINPSFRSMASCSVTESEVTEKTSKRKKSEKKRVREEKKSEEKRVRKKKIANPAMFQNTPLIVCKPIRVHYQWNANYGR